MFNNNLLFIKEPSPSLLRRQKCFLALALCFSVGAAAGALFGVGLSPTGFAFDFGFDQTVAVQNFPNIFIKFIWFHFLVVFLSTSLFGFAVLPFICALRGYVLSCTAATIISIDPASGIIMVLVVLGIPMLFSLTCFFALAVDGFFASYRLMKLSRGLHPQQEAGFILRCLMCVPFLTIGALLQMKLVPFLVTKLG